MSHSAKSLGIHPVYTEFFQFFLVFFLFKMKVCENFDLFVLVGTNNLMQENQ